MITVRTFDPQDISDPGLSDILDPWLNEAFTKGLIECLTAPIINLDPTKPEYVRRTEMILENFSREGYPVISTVISPGNMIQFIMPKDELLLSILFLREQRNTRVQVVIQKLIYIPERQP